MYNMPAKNIYTMLESKRNAYIQRARKNSEFTIPQYYPKEGASGETTYDQPYQGLGSYGVNSLANKIILSLFPPQSSFFKFAVPEAILTQTGRTEGDFSTALYKIEREVIAEMEATSLRAKLVEGTKKDMLSGSALYYIPLEGNPKVYGLEDFVLKRSKTGDLICFVIKELVSYLELPEKIKEQIPNDRLNENVKSGLEHIEFYTIVAKDEKDPNMYNYHQEIFDLVIDGSKAKYTKDKLPYIYVPFVDRGEDYGRSYVEDYLGDLISLEGLSRSMLAGAAESAKLLYLISPNSNIDPKEVERLESGSALLGTPEEISVLQANKSMDLSIVKSQIEFLYQQLSKVFLLDSSIIRDAERVTAEEVRRVAQELETSLGGIYSTLSNSLQEPLVRLYLNRVEKKGLIPAGLQKNLKLNIITGSAAQGRGFQFNAISTFVMTLKNTLSPEVSSQYIKNNELIKRLAQSLDINIDGLIKTDEEIAAEQEQARRSALQEQAVAPMISAAMQNRGQPGSGNQGQ